MFLMRYSQKYTDLTINISNQAQYQGVTYCYKQELNLPLDVLLQLPLISLGEKQFSRIHGFLHKDWI